MLKLRVFPELKCQGFSETELGGREREELAPGKCNDNKDKECAYRNEETPQVKEKDCEMIAVEVISSSGHENANSTSPESQTSVLQSVSSNENLETRVGVRECVGLKEVRMEGAENCDDLRMVDKGCGDEIGPNCNSDDGERELELSDGEGIVNPGIVEGGDLGDVIVGAQKYRQRRKRRTKPIFLCGAVCANEPVIEFKDDD
jgi:hypothetical protein